MAATASRKAGRRLGQPPRRAPYGCGYPTMRRALGSQNSRIVAGRTGGHLAAIWANVAAKSVSNRSREDTMVGKLFRSTLIALGALVATIGAAAAKVTIA